MLQKYLELKSNGTIEKDETKEEKQMGHEKRTRNQDNKKKIETRSLNCYGHILRVGPERVVRKVTFGWLKELENKK